MEEICKIVFWIGNACFKGLFQCQNNGFYSDLCSKQIRRGNLSHGEQQICRTSLKDAVDAKLYIGAREDWTSTQERILLMRVLRMEDVCVRRTANEPHSRQCQKLLQAEIIGNWECMRGSVMHACSDCLFLTTVLSFFLLKGTFLKHHTLFFFKLCKGFYKNNWFQTYKILGTFCIHIFPLRKSHKAVIHINVQFIQNRLAAFQEFSQCFLGIFPNAFKEFPLWFLGISLVLLKKLQEFSLSLIGIFLVLSGSFPSLLCGDFCKCFLGMFYFLLCFLRIS